MAGAAQKKKKREKEKREKQAKRKGAWKARWRSRGCPRRPQTKWTEAWASGRERWDERGERCGSNSVFLFGRRLRWNWVLIWIVIWVREALNLMYLYESMALKRQALLQKQAFPFSSRDECNLQRLREPTL